MWIQRSIQLCDNASDQKKNLVSLHVMHLIRIETKLKLTYGSRKEKREKTNRKSHSSVSILHCCGSSI
ncbi:hypothetical protein M513_13645 [Trichuris suis]|uniref:Uncharacterized protein n=1 Tax=Trichuris suis TaxID=68888 RepID=A0A085LKI1_9BILA|nr:hypothetical protein M513_13645 [Trichuris suis]